MSDTTKKIWSADVETHWQAPAGFFEQEAGEIAEGLKEQSTSLAQAMARLNFYINRAGTNLDRDEKEKLEDAKDILEALYQE